MAIHSGILTWRILQRSVKGYNAQGCKELDTTKATQDTYKRHSREKTSLADSSHAERETTEDDFVSLGLTS